MDLGEKVAAIKGSPMMTVIAVDGDKITCRWGENNQTMQGLFLKEELMLWIPLPKREIAVW